MVFFIPYDYVIINVSCIVFICDSDDSQKLFHCDVSFMLSYACVLVAYEVTALVQGLCMFEKSGRYIYVFSYIPSSLLESRSSYLYYDNQTCTIYKLHQDLYKHQVPRNLALTNPPFKHPSSAKELCTPNPLRASNMPFTTPNAKELCKLHALLLKYLPSLKEPCSQLQTPLKQPPLEATLPSQAHTLSQRSLLSPSTFFL